MAGTRIYKAFWIRGLWVLLMVVGFNVVLGAAGAGVAFLLRPIVEQPMIYAYTIVLLFAGLPLLGWAFEQLASRIPRIQ